MFSLQEAGLPPDHPALVKAATWLLDHQVLGGGDWQVNNPDVDPGGWAFEFRNDFYPDVDDTAFVLMALQRVAYPDPARLEQALRRGTAWVLSMQNRDGGWGAFDRDNDSTFLTRVPFADHNAMIDPSTGDLDGPGVGISGPLQMARFRSPNSARRAVSCKKTRTREGPWYGRWGVNYLYGTSGALRALETLGLQKKSGMPAGGGMAPRRAESRWRLWRILRVLRRSEVESARPKARLRKRRGRLIGLLAAGETDRARGEAGRGLPFGSTAGERRLGGSSFHRNRLSPEFSI